MAVPAHASSVQRVFIFGACAQAFGMTSEISAASTLTSTSAPMSSTLFVVTNNATPRREIQRVRLYRYR